VLNEWATGYQDQKQFSEQKNVEPYRALLKLIEAWDSLNPEVTRKMRQKWYAAGLYVLTNLVYLYT